MLLESIIAVSRKAVAISMVLTTVMSAPVAFASSEKTATPIKHLVIIFQENISFDHYFATYPVALNPKGEPQFVAKPGTPTVNGLTSALLNSNPNLLNAANGTGATNPFR